jgi:hypothetical protein
MFMIESRKTEFFFIKQKTYNLPEVESITGGSQGGYLRIDPYA